ncbi:MAG: ABC transporter ATP-binding protein [Lachnospiraceae bacterium]|nr:ABC transporter ATP-binding protein [Lachnospiraceae bacterium]
MDNKDKAEILRIDNLTYAYPKPFWDRSESRNVLEGINLSVKKGEIVGLAGESGCGKSTLAKCIVGINKVEAGITCRVKRGMVFQNAYGSLNPYYSVRAQMMEVLKLRGIKDKNEKEMIINDILIKVKFPEEYIDYKPGELSGGQRQRAAIALALLSDIGLLIADEPVSALDVTIQAQIIETLKQIRDETDLTIIVISHDLRTMYNLCDSIAIMKDGKIVEMGDKNKVYFKPEHEYTKLLIKSAFV